MELINISLKDLELNNLIFVTFTLLLFSNIFGYVFNKLKMPRVIGEIFAGILLGPSLLGIVSPEICRLLFNSFPEEGKILSYIYWLGLILLMLTSGFNLNHEKSSNDTKMTALLFGASTIIPMIGGFYFYKFYDFTPYMGKLGNHVSMLVVVCISIAITSIPVISKIFIDLNIINTRFAKIVLTAAVMHDLILWIGLDMAIQGEQGGWFKSLWLSTLTVVLVFTALKLQKGMNVNLQKKYKNTINDSDATSLIVGCCFFMLAITNMLGINIVFGALIIGILVGGFPKDIFQKARESISEFSLSFFIPIYFSIVGLKLNLPLYFDLNLFLSFFIISSVLVIGSVYTILRCCNNKSLTSLNFGFAMNARGGPGIVIACLAFEHSIIDERFYITLVLSAIFTSLISGTWFKYVLDRKLYLCNAY